MKIKEMTDILSTHGKRRTDTLIWESSLYYFGAILLNKYNYRKIIGSREFIRFYSIVFAQSGVGKSFTLSTLEKLFQFEQYGLAMKMYFERSIALLPEEPDNVKEILRYMPKTATTGLEGTKEGLFYITNSQVMSGFGSMNIVTEELGESISSSSEVLSKLKEMYDGKYKAKLVKGDMNAELKDDIENIICNFIGVGTRKGVTKDAERELNRIATSGMYRRCYIVDSKQYVEKNRDKSRIKELEEYLDKLNSHLKEEFISRQTVQFFNEKHMDLEPGVIEEIEEIDDLLIKAANDDRFDEFAQYDTGSLEMIIDLSHVIAFLEGESKVSIQNVKDAYDFMLRTRETIRDTFKIIHPYKIMYDFLLKKDNMTISEMAEIDPSIPIAKTQVNDNLALLEELCYRRNKILKSNEGKVLRFKIEELPINKLNKIIISVHNENRGEFAINFKPYEIDWESLKKIIVSDKVESFCSSHFESTAKAPDGHRTQDKLIEGSNIIVFDIDAGMSINEARELLSEYKYVIYTSKSHNIEKYEYRDRFRIILPTKSNFYVTPEQHKTLYINIEEFLGLVNNDIQTRNVSRLWYTNPNAETYENDGELFDVTYLLPSTDRSDNYLPKMTAINESMDEGEFSRREAGYVKWFIQNTTEGNRHENLTKAAYFFKELGLSESEWKHKIAYINQMLDYPMDERGMKFIYSIK